MQLLKKIFDFYIQSSLHVAFAVYALICITCIKLNISYDESVAYFGFYGTIVGYNFIKYDELARIKKIKLTKAFKAIIALSIIASLAAIYYFLELKATTKLIGFGALLLTILYTLPFFPNRQNMRNWRGVKIYLVALTWVGVTVVLPVINAKLDFSLVLFLACMQRFIFVFILLLIFEIIDMKLDEKFLETIPQQLGEKQTKRVSYVLTLVFLVLEFFKPTITMQALLIPFFVGFLLLLFTFFANSKRNTYYTSFWVESLPLIWLFLLLIFSQIF
jgi:hypothetical protein